MSDYYHSHSQEFIQDTLKADMSLQYHFFEVYLENKGKILDIGFGSGRDSLFFQEKGYEVYAIDPEEEFVQHGKELGLKNVYLLRAQDMDYKDMFDGIWACASLLHIPSKELKNVFTKCEEALKESGIMYVSFKYGNFEGKRNGRFYLDLTEEAIQKYTDMEILETVITMDVRPNRNEKWLNVILRKNRG